MKLVTKFIEKAGDGFQMFGVTFQQDGTIGRKDFFFKDFGEERRIRRPQYVYLRRMGSITASFTGQELDKGYDKGSYVILAGSGIYEGAKGGGSFEGPGAKGQLREGYRCP